MKTAPPPILQPRKTPVQQRSTATVEAIYEATVQVLLSAGAERLTTVRVAERAGVSVGTLYQYYPNKQSLLFAVLERHLSQVADSVVDACLTNHHQPLATMVTALIDAYLDAKLRKRETSMALYRIASDLEADRLLQNFRKRAQKAMIAMFTTVSTASPAKIEFAALFFFSAMGGAIRTVLETSASPAKIHQLRVHLHMLGAGYWPSALS
jgi:AcrR family transcriptional regulator